jgi:hypothetical protein
VQTSSYRMAQVLFLLAATTVFSVPTQAAPFTNASLKGGYSFLTNRWLADTTQNQDAVLGVLTCDGAGNVVASFISNSGGLVQSGTSTGTYTVNGNGTGTLTFPGTDPARFAIVLNSNVGGLAHGVHLLRNNNRTNYVESGAAWLQSAPATTYNAASIKGNFSLQLNKRTADATQSQDGVLGLFNFDGAGNVRGSVTIMSRGVLKKATFTGTYTVNSDGSGSMSLTVSDGSTPQLALVLNSTVAGVAQGLQVLQTNSSGNNNISGTAVKQ